MKLAAALLACGFDVLHATPSEYWARASPAVRRARERMEREQDSNRRGLRLRSQHSAPIPFDLDCGAENNETQAGTMWYTAGPSTRSCSRASRNLTYVYKDAKTGKAVVRTAIKGDLIRMHCDNWECPIPQVKNCYVDRNACLEDEWCMVETHEKWGQWAMGQNGHTPDFDHCGEEYEQLILEADATFTEDLNESRNAMCNSTQVGATAGYMLVDDLSTTNGYLTWMPSRGKCVKYRQEGESCVPTQSSTGAFQSEFIRRAATGSGSLKGGGSMDRPLACAPGLVCTGPDYDVLPSTCVKERPADLCYAGPWWISTACPRTAMAKDFQQNGSAVAGGMNRSWALKSLRSFLLLYPGEVLAPWDCEFWTDEHVQNAMSTGYSIAEALWPRHVVGPYPSWEEVSNEFFVVQIGNDRSYNLLKNMTAEICQIKDEDKQDVVDALASTALGAWSSMPNLIWSLIHFMMHNQRAPMPQKAVDASQALATHLSENFWCNDCRGFFTIGVLSVYGLPPDVPNGEAHARYWNLGHNVASEHVATTRGGHPWIVGLGAKIGNPFYMPYETAAKMWRAASADSQAYYHYY